MLTFYDNDMSVCAQKVRLVLFEKNLPFERKHLDLRAGDQFRPDYLALNPKAVVPTLVHDGSAIIESTVIIAYLDDAFSGTTTVTINSLGAGADVAMDDPAGRRPEQTGQRLWQNV